MLVSIIIPLYNKERHIRRAIDSVLAQTYQDFELIIIDDGSTDGSGNIVSNYTDSRIRLIVQKNTGVSVARNRGIAEATTELVAFLDADDEWHTDFLETVLSLRKKFPAAGVWATAYAMMDSAGQLTTVNLSEENSRNTNGFLINFFRTYLKYSSAMQQPCNASSIMVRKSALLKVGGFMPGLVLLEDTDALFRLALRYTIAYCPIVKSVYHIESENRSDAWRYYGNFPFFDHALDFLRECSDGRELSDDVKAYIGCYQTRGLSYNWYAGNRADMLKIISDCSSIRGYRLKCFIWRLLIWVPHPLVICYWKLNARFNGRNGKLPPIRSIYRKPSITG